MKKSRTEKNPGKTKFESILCDITGLYKMDNEYKEQKSVFGDLAKMRKWFNKSDIMNTDVRPYAVEHKSYEAFEEECDKDNKKKTAQCMRNQFRNKFLKVNWDFKKWMGYYDQTYIRTKRVDMVREAFTEYMPEVEASEEDNEEAPMSEDEVAESKEETQPEQDGESNDEPIPQPEDGVTEVKKNSYGKCSLTRYHIDNILMEDYPGYLGRREKWIKTQLKELIPYSTYTKDYEALETEAEKSEFMDETLIQELRNHRDHELAKNGKYTEYKYDLEDETKDYLEALRCVNKKVKTSTRRKFKDCIKLVMGYTAVIVTWKLKENQEEKKEYLKDSFLKLLDRYYPEQYNVRSPISAVEASEKTDYQKSDRNSSGYDS